MWLQIEQSKDVVLKLTHKSNLSIKVNEKAEKY